MKSRRVVGVCLDSAGSFLRFFNLFVDIMLRAIECKCIYHV